MAAEDVTPQSPVLPNFSPHFAQVLSRREWLRAAAVSATLLVTPLLPQGQGQGRSATTENVPGGLNFEPLPPSRLDQVVVAAGHKVRPLLRWGEPIFTNAPDWDPLNQNHQSQSLQFGYNNDFIGYFPFPYGSNASDHGLLVVNHEYTNAELMFPNYLEKRPTKAQVETQLAAHGASVVEIQKDAAGDWQVQRDSPYNRRIVGYTPIRLSGPAAGHPLVQTREDPEGRTVLGTLNNCSGGKTPWGTVLSGEENIHQYFGHYPTDLPKPLAQLHTRYNCVKTSSERRLEEFYPRFDIAKEPHEPNRFGWVVEFDPYDPESLPRKRTALGRCRHEAATVAVSPKGNIGVYMGDDSYNEYIYKFISKGVYNPQDRTANDRLLDEGTLYVARFDADGKGEWLPLVHGTGPLTSANGFADQGAVLINARGAGDLVGGTKMDRPEDIETNPVNKKVYIILTKNETRGNVGQPGPDAANPRAVNKDGHVLELTENGDDPAATTFTWDIFLICGDPKNPATDVKGHPKSRMSTVSCPDNLTFDRDGNVWLATDGMPVSQNMNDGLFMVPTQGPERGQARRFLTGALGSEICGPEFTPDGTTLFVSIQHPGEGNDPGSSKSDSTYEKPSSVWPDGNTPPRPAVVVVQADNGERIGRGRKA